MDKAISALTKLDRILDGQKRLLIAVHDNPDPDAIASAVALKYLAEKRFPKLEVSIAFGGVIGRAENRAMVSKLEITMKRIVRVRFERYDRIATVDTQPGAGNNSLPKAVECHIVIDHHPPRKNLKADLAVVEPEIGATATLLVEWLDASELAIPSDLATALVYAISSETQDLGREAGKRDIRAYMKAFTKASMRKLSQIIHPNLPREHFNTLAKALDRARSFRNLILVHLGEVPTPESVAEMADFLLRHERIGWALCTGRSEDRLILSLRTSKHEANAGKLLRKLVKKTTKTELDSVGGHDMTAGGFIPVESRRSQNFAAIEDALTTEFAQLQGYDNVEWKHLIEASASPRKKNRDAR